MKKISIKTKFSEKMLLFHSIEFVFTSNYDVRTKRKIRFRLITSEICKWKRKKRNHSMLSWFPFFIGYREIHCSIIGIRYIRISFNWEISVPLKRIKTHWTCFFWFFFVLDFKKSIGIMMNFFLLPLNSFRLFKIHWLVVSIEI